MTDLCKGTNVKTVIICRMATLAVAIAGLWQSVIGICQLSGLRPSLHAGFAVTGSFYNPGPLGGFLAMSLPIWLSVWMDGEKRACRWQVTAAVAAMALETFVLAISCSRAGWLAAVAGCLLVLHCRKQRHPKRGTASRASTAHRPLARRYLPIIAAAALVAAAATASYHLKPDSADGRVLMWKIGLKALALNPGGVGWHQVAGAYGDAQELYFSSGNATDEEKMIAGSPEYLFNEYLQVGLAWGIPAMLLMVIILCGSILMAMKSHSYATAGGLTAFAIFAFASYPLQFTLFHVCVVLLTASAVISMLPVMSRTWKAVATAFIAAATALAGTVAVRMRQEQKAEDAYSKSVRPLYTAGAYALHIERCTQLAGTNPLTGTGRLTAHGEKLYRNARFLFELGHALHRTGQPEASNRVLIQAMEVSSDPMILNIIAKNHTALGEYGKAEQWLLRSTHRLPFRMYPHYLLAQLYADGPIADQGKLIKESSLILEFPVKIKSPAVTEMQSQAKKWIEKFAEN